MEERISKRQILGFEFLIAQIILLEYMVGIFVYYQTAQMSLKITAKGPHVYFALKGSNNFQ